MAVGSTACILVSVEVASDLLTKGCGEFEKANTLDYTVTEQELPEPVTRR